MQCGESLGLGTRSLGMIGWSGATSGDLRTRLSSTSPDWPYMTEPSHAEELAGFRSASSLVIGLGTNDARRAATPAQYKANVTWFMQRAGGRPVLWFNLRFPQYQANIDAFNEILTDATVQWPNLRILDWAGYSATHPDVLAPDGIHLASYEACRQSRLALIQADVPAVTGQAGSPDWIDPAPLIPDPNPVTMAYEQSGGAFGPLGEETRAATCGHMRNGCIQSFVKGTIAWSPASGVHVMDAAIARAWNGAFGATGMIGYPSAEAVCGLAGGGCRQQFQGGVIYYSPAQGGQVMLNGSLLTRYLAAGAERGVLGYPRTPAGCGIPGTGCEQHFQGGSIYWTPTTGTHVSHGSIRSAWGGRGAWSGSYGFPTNDTTCGLRDGGCSQSFQNGDMFYSRATGAWGVTINVRTRYRAAGQANGALGYPVMDTRCALARGGCGQNFQNGSVYAASRTAPAFIVSGNVLSKWRSLGGEGGRYGYPVMDTRCGLARGGCGQNFQGGSVYATSRTAPAFAISGPMLAKWRSLGGEGRRYGYPLSDQRAIAGGFSQRFQGGYITYRNGRWY
jgi:hypothetical protein